MILNTVTKKFYILTLSNKILRYFMNNCSGFEISSRKGSRLIQGK